MRKSFYCSCVALLALGWAVHANAEGAVATAADEQDRPPVTSPNTAPSTSPGPAAPEGGANATPESGATNPPAAGTSPNVGASAPQSPDSANKPAPRPGYIGPLYKIGRALNDVGIFPITYLGEFYVTNPDFGVKEGSHQYQTQLNMGFDFNLEPLLHWHGGSIHYVEAIVPDITRQTATNNYFTQAGDVINASASGYVPVPAHLERFTFEQTFLHDQAFAEGGKGYVQDYTARPQCLNAFMCMSTIAITHKAAAYNFPNYSNWFGRTGYNITPEFRVQGLFYEYDTGASTTNGWQSYRPTYKPAYMVDAQWSRAKADLPSYAEALFYYNQVRQTDKLCFTCVTTTSNYQDGVYASAMQTVWRPDVKAPRMLQAFAAFGYAFNDRQTESPTVGGLNYAVDTGLILRAPLGSIRPADSVSLQFTAVNLTNDEQTYLTNQGYGAHGPTEYSFGGSANVKLYDFVFISPYFEYLKDANAAFASNAVTNPQHLLPKDGFALGFTFSIAVTQLLGLTTRSSGYDGHYP